MELFQALRLTRTGLLGVVGQPVPAVHPPVVDAVVVDTVSQRHLLTSRTVNNWGGRHFACVLHTTLIDDVINLTGYERKLDIIDRD